MKNEKKQLQNEKAKMEKLLAITDELRLIAQREREAEHAPGFQRTTTLNRI